MARASANRGKRPRPHARSGRHRERVAPAAPQPKAEEPKKRASYEDQLFFPRLRRRAKWLFLLLAAAFAIGFLAFGVGAGGTGIGDAIRDLVGAGTAGPSVEDAQERVEDDPTDPEALRDLATALQAEQRPDEAADALNRYLELRPDDTTALRELVALYDIQANTSRRLAALFDAQTVFGSFNSIVYALPGQSGFFGALGQDPISDALTTDVAGAAEDARQEVAEVARKQVPALQRLVELQPTEAVAYLQLGQAAATADEDETAIAAFEKFLELAPDDPNAAYAQQALAQLEATGDILTG